MIRDIFLFSILISALTLLLYSFFTNFSSVINYDFYSSSNELENMNAKLGGAYQEVYSYTDFAYTTVGNVSTSPEQTEGVDIIAKLGRFATVVVKTFVSAFTIPIEVVGAIATALKIDASYSIISSYILTAVFVLVVLEVLSIATRYPLDR